MPLQLRLPQQKPLAGSSSVSASSGLAPPALAAPRQRELQRALLQSGTLCSQCGLQQVSKGHLQKISVMSSGDGSCRLFLL